MTELKRLPIIAISGFLVAVLGTSCAAKKVTLPVPTVSAISSYCPYLPSRAFAGGVTVSGTASYQYRTNGNGGVAAAPNPIRYAEVEVLDSTGAIVQCDETDGAGAFSFDLPANSGDYTVKVNARANNSFVKAYVMNNPTDNSHYSISTTVASSSNASLTMIAPATGSVISGAFNILDKIVDANVFLRTYASATECGSFSDCRTFTVAPIAYAYWTAGFNPNTYLGGSSTSGVSFFLKGTNELYILGGIEGDVDSSDCDHFDNSIILHEYGHFIESNYSVSDSPGGRHAPNEVIDPRLAWSEGFANFFQAAVTGNAVYRDTEGNVSCGSGCTQAFHDEDLEVAENYDLPGSIVPGEGAFHEFAITRVLWDAIDPHPVTGQGGNDDPGNDLGAESVTSDFAEIWTVFAGTSNGFASASQRLRSSGLFMDLQALMGATDWATIRTHEDQPVDQTDFATPLTVPGACGPTSLQVNGGTDGSFEDSNQFYDNDFYAYYHSSGALKVRVAYTPGAVPADIDLIVWKDGYEYGVLGDALAASRQSRLTDGGDEQISVTAPAGWYMINVMGLPNSTGAGGSAMTYDLYVNDQQACPNP